MSKTCPFCRKQIDQDDFDCKYCNRIIKERIDTQIYGVNSKKQQKENISTFSTYYKKIKSVITHSFRIRSRGDFNNLLLILILIIIALAVLRTDNTLITDAQRSNFVSLQNGTFIASIPSVGRGELHIKNGTESDAVVKMVSTYNKNSIFSVYIKAKSAFSIQDISDGNYVLYFHLGNDWNTESKVFRVNPHYAKFDDSFSYTTSVTQSDEGRYISTHTAYSTYTITLNPVVAGNARTSSIDKSEFEKF